MDYSVGNLADLISGVNTPNKQKVTAEEYKVKINGDGGAKSTPRGKRGGKKEKKRKFSENAQDGKMLNGYIPAEEQSSKKKKKNKEQIEVVEGESSEKSKKKKRQSEDNSVVEEKSAKKKKNKRRNEEEGGEAEEETPKKKKKQQWQGEEANEESFAVEEPEKKKKKKKKSLAAEEETNVEEDSDKKEKKKKKKSKQSVSEDVPEENSEEKSSKKKQKPDASFAENAQRRVEEKDKTESHQPKNPEHERRTVFVGNVPKKVEKMKIIRLFQKHGKVEAVRIRSIAIANPKVPKKVAIIKKELHPQRTSVNAFVRFDSRESAIKALEENGRVWRGHHIRVKLSVEDEDAKKPDQKYTIFLGNVHFAAEDEEIWKIFSPCGEIESVRIIRDARTNIGKGIAYVNFKTSDGVALALEMTDVEINKRPLRIKRAELSKKKDSKGNKVRKVKRNKGGINASAGNEGASIEKKGIKQGTPAESSAYQGRKVSDKKKKNKMDKGEMKKKKFAKKLLPIPK